MEVVRFEIEDQLYSARVSFSNDYILYHIYLDIEYLCTIGLNEHGTWETVENVDQNLVRHVGSLIEDHSM